MIFAVTTSMSDSFYRPLRSLILCLMAGGLLAGSALAGTDSMDCSAKVSDRHAELAAGDHNSRLTWN